MAYKDPNDERRIQKDFEYMNSERGYVGRAIGGKLKPSYGKYGGHIPDKSCLLYTSPSPRDQA